LREVAATLQLQKRYLFVHEVDADRGGAPLEALRCELMDVEQRAALFDGRPVTVWCALPLQSGPISCIPSELAAAQHCVSWNTPCTAEVCGRAS
jgi:hypothetical protein